MLSIETEARVAKLFLNLAEGEKSVEINRQVLADQLDFDPYQAFKRLDTQGKNSIDEFDIVDFLKLNSVYSTYNEARFIIFFHDADGDGSLSYNEFLNLVISEFNYSLRRVARERFGYPSRLTLPYDVEYSLSKVFERELDLVRNVELLLSDVKARYDFNAYDLYSSIQTYSFVNADSIRKFLLRNDVDVTESEVQAIIKRIDTDRDGRISFTEFKRFFSFPAGGSLKDSYKSEGVGGLSSSNFFSTKSSLGKFDSPLRRTASPQRGLRYVSPNRSVRYTSPLRTTYRSPVRSPVRVSSPMRSPVRVRSPIRSSLSPVRSTNLSIKSVDRTRVGPSLTSSNFGKTFYSTYPSYEEENFLNFLRDVIVIENDIERSKSDLALRSDFNIEDAFRIFELDGRGYLSDLDLKFGLNSLDLFPTSEEISLFIKRFDARNEGVLSFANFFDAIAPLDREYRRMLEVRLPSAYPTRNKADVFLPSTKLYFQNLLSLILKSEARVEGWRQRLNKMPRFSVRTTFDRIDRLEKNYITEADVSSYLKRHEVSFFSKDVELLLLRLDRDRDGRISYLEFSDEIYPKSKHYFSI